MAGDWIKIEHTTPDKPEVMRMAKALGMTPESVIGHLSRVWIWADQQSLNGHSLSVTESDVDVVARHAGIAKAMRDADWLRGSDGALSFPKFERHNGKSAKKRALAAERKRVQRSRDDGDESVTRGEERRGEDIKTETIGAIGLPILPTNIPYKEIVTLFNEKMGKLSMVRELTLKRRQAVRAAWSASKVRQELKFWKAYFEECADDDFLNGTGPYSKGHENWRPTFDYLLRNDVITRVYEKAMSDGG